MSLIDESWHSARNVLLMRLDNLGDVLLTTPALHAVRIALPRAKLTLLASSIGAQCAALNPDLDDAIVYAAPWMDPWRSLPQDSEREQRMIALLKERHFDAAIIFTSFRESSLPAAYMCYLADIPLRLAASTDGAGSLLTTRHKYPDDIVHEVEHNLDLVRVVGMDTDERDLVLKIPDAARNAVNERLLGLGITRDKQHPFVVVHPGCTMPARTYPWEMYVEVIDLLVEQLGASVVVTGMNDERELVERVLAHVRTEHRDQVYPMAGLLPFPEFCALIQAADLTITNNTGPMHISAAVKTPVIALFALTNPPQQWGPWHVPHRQMYRDVPCRICFSRICPYQHECLRLVSPQMVVDAANELLSSVQNDYDLLQLHSTPCSGVIYHARAGSDADGRAGSDADAHEGLDADWRDKSRHYMELMKVRPQRGRHDE